MDQSTGALNENEKRSVDDIERDIHRTQREMSRTIDSIQYRLSPGYMKSRAREQMKETSRGMIDRIKENPAAAAVAAAGLYMLFRGDSKSDGGTYDAGYGYIMICDACGLSVDDHTDQGHGFTERARDRASEIGSKAKGKMEDLQQSASDAAHNVTDRAHEAGERVSEKAHEISRRARQGVRRTGRKAQQRFDQDPLLMGAIGIAAGALLGALIPETDRERELMGDARDELVDRTKELAKEKGEQIRQVAEHAKDAAVDEAKQEAKRQDLTGKGRDERPEPGLDRPAI